MSYSNGMSEEGFLKLDRDIAAIDREIAAVEPKLQALKAKQVRLTIARDALRDYFGAPAERAEPVVAAAPEVEPPARDRRRRARRTRENGGGHVETPRAAKPTELKPAAVAALQIVLESPMGVTTDDIREALYEQGITIPGGPLVRSLNTRAAEGKIYRADDGRWHAAVKSQQREKDHVERDHTHDVTSYETADWGEQP